MFLCGDDEPAKEAVSGLATQLGWEPLDVGGLEQALHLEHMTLLWVRMVRAKKHSPNMVWAVLRR
jgi:predicted dinucleotide-binding enzyme